MPAAAPAATPESVFGNELNLLNPAARALLETFVNKGARPANTPDKLKVHEVTADEGGQTMRTTSYISLDWSDHSFKTSRKRKPVTR